MERDETLVERFGYTLPAKSVMATAHSLIRTGFPTQVWLGISGDNLPAAAAAEFGLSGGAVLKNVAVNSPASECGLMALDVVTKLNTTPVDSMTRLVMALRELRPADTVAIEYLRNGVITSCFAALAPPPEVGPELVDGTGATTATTAAAATSSIGPPAVMPAGDGAGAGAPAGSTSAGSAASPTQPPTTAAGSITEQAS